MEDTIKDRINEAFRIHINKKIEFWKRSLPYDSINLVNNTIEFSNSKKILKILKVTGWVLCSIIMLNLFLLFYLKLSILLIFTLICLLYFLYSVVIRSLFWKTVLHIDTGRIDFIIFNRVLRSNNLINLTDIDSRITIKSRFLKGIFSQLVFSNNSKIYLGYTLDNTECVFIGDIFLPIRKHNKRRINE